MTSKTELFWYQTQCSKCKSTLEHTFSPEGSNYAERYQHFVSAVAPSRYQPNYVSKHCDTCNQTTSQEVLRYAPAYNMVE